MSLINKVLMLAATLSLCCCNVACMEGMTPPTKPTPKPTDEQLTPITDQLVATAGATELMRSKAAQLREATGVENGALRSAVYIYSATVEKYAQEPKKLAARVALLGMSDVYLSISRDVLTATSGNQRAWYGEFISALHTYNIKVYAMRLQNNSIYLNPESVRTEVEAVKAWNGSVVASARIDGISADLEPHTMKSSDSSAQQLGYYWDSTNNYGVGGSNDRLVGLTLDRLGYAKELLGDLELCEALFSAFQPKYNQGLLSKGCADDFLAVCDWVMVMAYRTTADKVWTDVEHYLKAASANYKASVSVAVKVHQNELDSVSPSLKPLGWQGVVEALESITERGKAWSAFRGVDYFQWVGLEDLWETL